MRRVLSVLMLLLCSCVALLPSGGRALAQSFDLNRDREMLAPLEGLWRFHLGDDPGWASPSFDDARWPLLRSDQDWAQQGYKGVSGMAWYRFQVIVPQDSPRLALYVPGLLTSYELFVDGQKIGQYGEMPPRGVAHHILATVFTLPASASTPGTHTFAIRVWHWKSWASYYGGGPLEPPLLGDAALIRRHAADGVQSKSWGEVAGILLLLLELLAGMAALGFFAMRTDEREYLWFGLLELSSVAADGWTIWCQNYPVSVLLREFTSAAISLPFFIFFIAFFMRLLNGRRDWMFRAAVGSIVIDISFKIFSLGSGIAIWQIFVVSAVCQLPLYLWALVLLVRSARKGMADARLLLFPVLLIFVSTYSGLAVSLSFILGWQRKIQSFSIPVGHWPFEFSLDQLSNAVWLLAMLAILMNRFSRTRREEERYARDAEAARTVQQVLLPEPAAQLPGYRIEAEFVPAQEVGGDFYQVIPSLDGGLLVVTGDVSGKGMPAAMLVALIVGAIRTEAAHTSDPASLLATLNRRIHGRMSSGFATCAVLHLAQDGSATVANAGNPPPYLNGEEMGLPGALPLGLLPEMDYESVRFHLDAGDTLTFVSDGIVEATSDHTGEMFGFERAQAISRQSASAIAQAARAFGQRDDITVLTIEREPVRST